MRNLPPVGVVALAAMSLAAHVISAQNPQLQAVIGGAGLPSARVESIVVDSSTIDVDDATLSIDAGRAKPPWIGE